MNVRTFASLYEFRPMVKSGPAFEIYPSRWDRFWAWVARRLLLTR